MSDKMRESFENWALDNGYSLKVYDSFHEEYYHGATHAAWQAWQAAQAEQSAELERLRKDAGRVPEGWQPIETAPKDGVFLLCLPATGALKHEGRRVYEGRWHPEQNTFTSVNGFILLTDVTHWMPLPTAPKQKEGE